MSVAVPLGNIRRNTMRKLLFLVPALAASFLLLGLVHTKATSFTLKDPKSVNSIRFTLDVWNVKIVIE